MLFCQKDLDSRITQPVINIFPRTRTSQTTYSIFHVKSPESLQTAFFFPAVAPNASHTQGAEGDIILNLS